MMILVPESASRPDALGSFASTFHGLNHANSTTVASPRATPAGMAMRRKRTPRL
jgi:hypothetical protein